MRQLYLGVFPWRVSVRLVMRLREDCFIFRNAKVIEKCNIFKMQIARREGVAV
jgi:hypothetical protein